MPGTPPRTLLGALLAAAVLAGSAARPARAEDGPPPAAKEEPARPEDPGDILPSPSGGFTDYAAYESAELDEANHQVILKRVQGVFFGRDDFEIEADSLILWVDEAWWRANLGGGAGKEGKEAAAPPKEGEAPPKRPPRYRPKTHAELRKSAATILGPGIRELYAEGDVRFRVGDRTIRAESLYADFRRDILATGRVTLSTSLMLPYRGNAVPLIIRADRLRRTAENQFTLDRASYTTCDFGEPHFHFRCREFVLTDEDERTSFSAYGNVLWWGHAPVFWIPYLGGSSDLSARPLRSVTAGRSSRFGTEVSALWGDDIVLGKEKWGEWRLHTDWRSRRGFGEGADLDYDTKEYQGRFRAYYQRDHAPEDGFNDTPVPRRGRWEIKDEHRQRLSDEWRLDLSYRDFSDRNFQPEYFKQEALEERDPESYAYLRYAHGTDLASLSAKLRVADFLAQTEELPAAAFHRVGAPGPAGGFLGRLLDSFTYSADASAGAYERKFDEADGVRSERVLREDVSARLEGSAGLGPVRLVPFFTAGTTRWQGGGLPGGASAAARGDAAAGLRIGIEARRSFDEFRSGTFDLHGLRHVVGLDALYFNRWLVTEPSSALTPLDALETVDRVEAVGVRLRNRLQTTRGGARVDWLDLEVRGLYFPAGLAGRASPFGFREEGIDGPRFQDFTGEERFRAAPPRGRWGPYEADLRVRLFENFFVIGEGELDAYDRALRTSLLGVRWFLLPKVSLYAGDRRIRGDSDIYTFKADWAVSDRWNIGVTQQADLRSNRGLLTQIAIRRVLHDFVIEVSIQDDRTTQDKSFRFSIVPSALWAAPTSLEKAANLDYDAKRYYR